MRRLIPLILLLNCLPVMAGPTQSCAVAEDNSASAPVQEHRVTAAVLERLQSDRTFTVRAAAAQLREAAADDDALNEVVGHLRWAIRNSDGEPRATAYDILEAMSLGGRADVAEQFIAGIEDVQQHVRQASAMGLRMAPSGKRDAAGTAVFDRLGREADPDVYHSLLDSLTVLASPTHKSRVDELRKVLSMEQPAGMVPDHWAQWRVPDHFEEWKFKAARAVINVIGPADAIALFRDLDVAKPGERFAIEGAVRALAVYAMEHFTPEMDPGRRDGLRDLLRDYGVPLLSQESAEEAERDARVRSAVVTKLFPVVLGRPEFWRPGDVDQIRSVLVAALPKERDGSKVAGEINRLLSLLDSGGRRS